MLFSQWNCLQFLGDLKVAFSAALTDSGSVGPFDQETTLIFSKVFSAVGGAYNPTEGPVHESVKWQVMSQEVNNGWYVCTSGVFTAPVRGIYFFSFTAADFLKGYMGLYLYKNNQPIIFNLNLNDHGGYASTSSNMALQLEEGDRVHLTLPASYRLYDDSRNFSIFSGFLLFTLWSSDFTHFTFVWVFDQNCQGCTAWTDGWMDQCWHVLY